MTESTFFSAKRLLKTPIKRAAYSDRTAWLMAEMSRLAYEKFEGNHSLKQLASKLVDLTDVDEIAQQMNLFLEKLGKFGNQTIAEALAEANFTLQKIYDNLGTQAFLAELSDPNNEQKMLVLAFRGTETNYEDIRADLRANLVPDNYGNRVHRGFLEAFRAVEDAIRADLEQYSDRPIYITGHSLGGAMAILATKYLANDSAGACYTFGGPRVGGKKFRTGIKTPIYRVVNAADGVPRVPPSWVVDLLIFAVHFIPYFGSTLERLLQGFQGYVHLGDMRYLTHVKPDQSGTNVTFPTLQLISNPSLPERIRRFIARFILNYKAPAQDHSIMLYSQKLRYYAIENNPISSSSNRATKTGSANIELETSE